MARALAISPPVVVGLVMGGAIVVQAAFLHPEAIPTPIRVHDHAVHALVYGVVGAAVAWWSIARAPARGVLYHLAAAQLVALHLGVVDEIVQSASLGRESSLRDLCADGIGSVVGAVALLLLSGRGGRRGGLTIRAAAGVAIYVAVMAAAMNVGPARPAPRGLVVAPSVPAASSCGDGTRGLTWRLDIGAPAARPALRDGFSVDERVGDRSAVWTEGERSRIEVALVARATPYRLGIVGMSVDDPARRELPRIGVVVNGRRLGHLAFPHDFVRRTLTVPAGLLVPGANSIELEHAHRYVPPADGRGLSVMLDEVCLEPLD